MKGAEALGLGQCKEEVGLAANLLQGWVEGSVSISFLLASVF